MQSSNDRRRRARVSVCIGYTLEHDARHCVGVTGNVSLSGVYLVSCSPAIDPPAVGSNCELTLDTGPKPVTLRSRIVYVGGGLEPGPEGVGVVFEDNQSDAKETLREFILSKI